MTRARTLQERLHLFRKVCSAVTYAHQHLVIHRDLKPANIRVTAEGEPKLLDFGIAKLIDSENGPSMTLTLQGVMTPEYASPEQVGGGSITTASDVYSLGVVLYNLLTGQSPYRTKTNRPNEIARAITEQEPVRPSAITSTNRKSKIQNRKSLRGDLDNIILMAMRKEPERRYASANAFSEDILRYLEGLPVRARKDTLGYRASKFVQRNRPGVLVGVLALAALLGAMGMIVAEKRRADRRFNDVRQLANSLLFEVEGEIQKGPTRAREKLVRHAMTYLDSLAQEVKNDPGLQLEVAAGYLKVGDIQGKPYRPNLGDTAAALASYAKAAQILTPLSSAPGDNREAQRYLSLALQNIGRVQIRNGDWARALENERKAVALAEPLAQAAPGNDQYHSLLADNYLHLGAALYQAGRSPRTAEYAEAINSFRKALAIHLRLVEKHPDKAEYRYATGVDYEYIGIAYNFLGDLTGDAENYQRALENHIKELEINEALVASDPTNEAYRRIRADAYGEAGLSQLKLGLAAEALANFRKKLAIFESIEASDPTNVEARRDVANARREVAQALAAGGEIAGGLEQAAKACAALEALRVTEPDTAETLFYLIDAYNETGELQKRMSNYDAATGVYANALRLLDEWNKKEPASAVGHRLFAVTHFNLAVLHETVAQTAPSSAAKMNWNNARDCYERSLRLWQQLPDDKLSSRDRARITEIRGHLARCERALSQL